MRTWLVGILKHKIIDQIRRGSREVALVVEVADGEEGDFDALFDQSGHFVDSPGTGATPSSHSRKSGFSRYWKPAWTACRPTWEESS